MASKPGRIANIIGWVLTILPTGLLTFSGIAKFGGPEKLKEGFDYLGWPVRYATGLGILELVCVALFLIPQTLVLGAVLLTGYIGGAMATHVRIGDPVYVHIALGIVIWLAVFFREPRLRPLLPLRR